MSFVIHNSKTFKVHTVSHCTKVYETERAAKTAKTKAKLGDDWNVITKEAWWAIEVPMVDRVSAQDGKTIMRIPADQVGTACDPGMERYWTM